MEEFLNAAALRSLNLDSNSPREERMEVPWGTIAFKTWNSPSYSPVLVVHGLWDNAGVYDKLIPLLDKNFYYVCVDLPGHGYSSPLQPGMPLTFIHHVAVLQRIISIYKWPRFSLIGHSFGANLCLFLAATPSCQVEKLILLESTIQASFISQELHLIRCKAEFDQQMKLEFHLKCPYYESYEMALESYSNSRLFTLPKNVIKSILARSLVRTTHGFKVDVDPRDTADTRVYMDEAGLLSVVRSIRKPVLAVFANESELSTLFIQQYFNDFLQVLDDTHEFSQIKWVDGNHSFHCIKPETIAPIINKFITLSVKSKM